MTGLDRDGVLYGVAVHVGEWSLRVNGSREWLTWTTFGLLRG